MAFNDIYDDDELDDEGLGDINPPKKQRPPQPPSVGNPSNDSEGTGRAGAPGASIPSDPDNYNVAPSAQAQQAPPAPAGGRLAALIAQKPQVPQPAMWKRLLAAGLGGFVGAENARVGYPGGPRQKIDDTAGVNNILGLTAYQRNLANWEQNIGAEEKLATIQEQEEAARLRREAAADNMKTNAFYRQGILADRAQQREQQKQNAIEKYQTSAPYTGADVEGQFATPAPLGPPPVPQGGLPAFSPPQDVRDPQSYTKQGFSPMQPPPGYQGPPRFEMTPAALQQQKSDEAEQLRTAGFDTMSQDLYDQLTKAGVAVNAKPGEKVPPAEMNRMFADYDKRTAPPTQKNDENYWLGVMADPKASPQLKIQAKEWLRLQAQQKLAGERPPASANNMPTDDELDNLAEAVANYDVDYNTAMRMYGAGSAATRAKLQTLISKHNPDYKQWQYDEFKRAEGWANVGQGGTQSNALQTMVGHLNTLKQAATALGQNNLIVLNAISNSLGMQAGSNAKTVYDTIVHRLGPEITKFYVGGGGSAGERGTNEEDFASKYSPQQILGNIGASAELAKSKLAGLQYQYQRSTYGRGKQQLVSPETQQQLNSLSQAPGVPGSTVHFTSPANPTGWNIPADQVAAFKKAHPEAQQK